MNADKLKEILADHKVWAESFGKSGKRAVLHHADLHHADLRNADLRGADLRGAELVGAHLTGADLSAAHLDGANLSYADLTGAHFELEFKSVRYFSDAIFSEAAIPWVILHSRWSEWADSVMFV